MADQGLDCLPAQLQRITDAELASLVVEFVETDQIAVPLGEEIYRRLLQRAQPTPALSQPWSGFAQSARALSHSPLS